MGMKTPETPYKLSNYPYVVVRISCRTCKRRGQYRLVNLAVKYGADASLDDVIDKLTDRCPYRNDRSSKHNRCLPRFIDLMNMKEPDMPPRRFE